MCLQLRLSGQVPWLQETSIFQRSEGGVPGLVSSNAPPAPVEEFYDRRNSRRY